MSRHWLPAVLVLGATLVAGTACSTAGTPTAAAGSTTTATTTAAPSPVTVSDIKSAIQSASAVHIKGTMTDSGSSVSLDVQINKDGSASGTLGEGGANIPIVFTKKVVYIQFTADVMKANGVDATGAAGQLLLNKWVPSTSPVLSGSGIVSGVTPLLDYTTFTGNLIQQIPAGTPKAGKTDTVGGTPVQLYTFSDGTVADIATAGPHYVMRLTPSASQGSGSIDFTGWNQPVAVHAPPASQIYAGPGA
ncbi:MAG TPA: hypothetical protein VH333_20195 [Pseudonocardiaceae bacterium]|jgi:hypothetical protein|nr:hypothetical protein [Pseudonocardiaceae bacterium]